MSDNKEKAATKAEKKSKIQELKKKSVNEMNLQEARAEVQLVKLQAKTGEEKDTTKIKKLKKHIARLLTKQNSNK